MRHIGILAVTYEGAGLLYRTLCRDSEALLGAKKHPEITMHTHNFSRYFVDEPKRRETWVQLMVDASEKLAAAGAEFFVCAANTNHEVYDEVSQQAPIPWLHIVDPVQWEAEQRGYKRLFLLGTKRTMTGTIYQKRLQNIEVSVPKEKDQNRIHEIIYDELIQGITKEDSRNFFSDVIASAKADAVILGCTELPLIVRDVSLPILDSTALLAHAALHEALNVS